MQNHFDKVAQNWDNNPIHKQRTEAIAKELKKIIPSNNNLTALEFGAGTGLLSVAMKDYFLEITLMDSSFEMVKVTNEKIENEGINNLKIVLFDLEENDYLENTFDVIFTQMSIHHVVDIDKIVAKFYKLLNKNGSLVIADLYEEDGSFHEKDFKGHLGFNPFLLSQKLTKQGFKEINHYQCFEIKKTNKPNKYPVFFMWAKK